MNVARMRTAGIVGAAMLGVAVSTALAGPASADLSAGTYTRGIGGMVNQVSVTACGPDCLFLQTPGTVAFELRRQGAVWTGSYTISGQVCAVTVDSVTLAETDACGDKGAVTWQLARVG